MQTEVLRKEIEVTLTKKKVLKLTEILKEDLQVKELIELSFDSDPQIGFRAAWILENLLLDDPHLIVDNLDGLMLRLPHVFNPSCQRHYAKILMCLTSTKSNNEIKTKMQVTNLEPIVETCFDWLINPKVTVAVKVFCCEVLLQFKKPLCLDCR